MFALEISICSLLGALTNIFLPLFSDMARASKRFWFKTKLELQARLLLKRSILQSPKTLSPSKEKSPKKRPIVSSTAPPPKKPRNLAEASAMVAKDFEKHALLHVEQKELNAWKARSKEEARDAIRSATTELFFHNVVDESMKN